MLGGLPPKEKKEEKKKIGTTEAEDIAALKKELKWMKWAIILLIVYVMYKETKKS
jgi:hypothetical protein